MQTLVVGRPFPGAHPPLPEGVALYLSGSCPEIRFVLSRISKQEAKHFHEGKLRFSLYAPEDLSQTKSPVRGLQRSKIRAWRYRLPLRRR